MLVKITFQFVNPDETTKDLTDRIMNKLDLRSSDVEEIERTDMTVIYEMNDMLSVLRDNLRNLLAREANIAYADVWYRCRFEFCPDRFVIWQGGHEQDYTGHVEFTEDNY